MFCAYSGHHTVSDTSPRVSKHSTQWMRVMSPYDSFTYDFLTRKWPVFSQL